MDDASDAGTLMARTDARKAFVRLLTERLEARRMSNADFVTRMEVIAKQRRKTDTAFPVAPNLRTVQGWLKHDSFPRAKYLPLMLEALTGLNDPDVGRLRELHAAAEHRERRKPTPAATEPPPDAAPAVNPAGWYVEPGHNTLRLVEMIVHTPPNPNDPDTAVLRASVSLGEESCEVDSCLLTFRLSQPYIVAAWTGCEPEPGSRLGERTAGPSAEAPHEHCITFTGGTWSLPAYDPAKPGSESPLVGDTLALVRVAPGGEARVQLDLHSGGRVLHVTAAGGRRKLDAMRAKLIQAYLRKEIGDPPVPRESWARSSLRKNRT